MNRHGNWTKAGAAAATALSLAPASGAAAPVYVTDRPVTVSFDALGGGIGSTGVGWDIDGVNGDDTQFRVSRVAHGTTYTNVTASGSTKVQYARGALNFPGLYGFGPVIFAREFGRSFLIDVPQSSIVGPEITPPIAYTPPPFNGMHTYARLITPPGGTPEIVSQGATFSSRPYGADTELRLMPFGFDVNGQQHVGWARIRFDYAPKAQLVIERWAYESEPNTEIHVNNIPAPPAAIPALTLLALGAAGVRRWRKRQATNRSQTAE